MTTIRRARTTFRQWRQEPWPFLRMSEQSRAYRAWIVASDVGTLVVGISALVMVVRIQSTGFDWIACLVATFALAAIIIRSLHENGHELLDVGLVVPLALITTGHTPEAVVSESLACVIAYLRKPLAAHLAIGNILNLLCFHSLMGLAFVTVAAGSDALSMRWLAGSTLTLLTLFACQLLIQQPTMVLGRYLTATEAVRGWWRESWMSLHTTFPISLVVGAVMLMADTRLASLAMTAPLFMSLQVFGRADELRQVREVADRDPLTGLLNRGAFERVLDGWIATRGSCWLLVLDLDNFKTLNDTRGHDAGDQAIIAAGRQIKGNTDQNAACARFGGDEFVVLLDEPDGDQVLATAHGIVDGIASELGFLGISASIGVHRVRPGETPAAVFSNADHAMYEAKRGGKGIVALSDGTSRHADDSGLPDEDTNPASQLSLSDMYGIGTTAHVSVEQQSMRQQAYRYWNEIAERADRAGNRHLLAAALYQLYWASTDPVDAARYLDQVVQLDDGTIGWAAQAAAAAAFRGGDVSGGIGHERRALELARHAGDRSLEAVSLNGLAHGYARRLELDAATGLLREGIRLAKLSATHEWVVQCYLKLISVLRDNLQLGELRNEAFALRQYIERQELSQWEAAGAAVTAASMADAERIDGAIDLILPYLDDRSRISFPDPERTIAQLASVLLDGGHVDAAGELMAWGNLERHPLALEEQSRLSLMQGSFGADVWDLPARTLVWVGRHAARTGDRALIARVFERATLLDERELTPFDALALRECVAVHEAFNAADVGELRRVESRWRSCGCLLAARRCSLAIAAALAEHGRYQQALGELDRIEDGAELTVALPELEWAMQLHEDLGTMHQKGTPARGTPQSVPRGLDAFRYLPEAELEALASTLVEVPFERGDQLAADADHASGILLVRDGLVAIVDRRAGSDDAAIVLGEGDLLHISIAGSVRSQPGHAEALEPGVALMASGNDLLDLSRQCPLLAAALMQVLDASSTDDGSDLTTHLVRDIARGRLLLELEADAGHARQPTELEDLMQRTGLARVHLLSIVDELERAGIVTIEHELVWMRDATGIEPGRQHYPKSA